MGMTAKEFEKLLKDLHKKEQQILVERAKRYATEEDRLKQFKEASELLGMTPMQYALCLLSKHFLALKQAIQKDELPLPGILEEWIVDIRNYLALIYALWIEALMLDERGGNNDVV